MVIVTGHLLVDPADRDAFLADARAAVEQGRAAEGCLDFAQSPDPVDPGRINICERWESQALLDQFRGDGTPGELASRIRGADVAEYDVAAVRRLT